MATSIPDSVLQTFLSKNFDGNTRWNLKGIYLHRLVGSFIWLRASALSTRQNLTAAAAVTEVTKEISQVKAVVTDRLGANNRSGPLAGAQNPETPPHLDLADVSKQRTSDLGAPDPARTKQIQKTQAAYVRERRREVLGILWRAAALEFQLWEDANKNLVSLDTGSLKNLLDRRLRAVERLHANVGPHSGSRTLATVTTHNSGWFDNMRVRLFEYPHVTLSPAQRPIVAPDVGTQWQAVPGSNPGPNDNQTLFFAVLQPAAVRQYNGSSTDTQSIPSPVAWRFPSATQPSWVVSPGKDSGYRIDLVPAGSATGAALIDAMFSYQGTSGGAPEKADLWNRAWILCDHAISAIQLEALLFALRRQNPSTADATFNALVALRPNLTVHRLNDDDEPLATTAKVASAFVSLDGHLQSAGVLTGSYRPDPQILMNNAQPDTSTFVDLYFRNVIGNVNDLQVGDWVKILSNPVYDSLQPSGVWGLENALVMDVDPDVANLSNRGGIKLDRLLLEGHGLSRKSYPDFKTELGEGLTSAIAGTRTLVFNAATPRPVFLLPVGDPSGRGCPLVEWAPYDAFTTIKLNLNAPTNPTQNVQPQPTGPWWVALPLRDFADGNQNPDDVTPAQALARVPGAVGQFHVTTYALNPDPTINNTAARAKLGLGPDDNLFDHFVLFPLVEPQVQSQSGTSGQSWNDLFFFHGLTKQPLDNVVFRMLVADQKTIPGFARTGGLPGAPLDQVPMIQPRPRRST